MPFKRQFGKNQLWMDGTVPNGYFKDLKERITLEDHIGEFPHY
jgi:hypothetical protein